MPVQKPISLKTFMADIQNYCQRHGISPTEFGKRVYNDGSFFGRIAKGRSPTLARIEEAYDYMQRTEVAIAAIGGIDDIAG